MRKSMVIGALLAALAAGVVAMVYVTASSAEEETQYLCAGEPIRAPGECFAQGSNLETVVMQDRGSDSEIECAPEAVLEEGTEGPGAEDEVSAISFKISASGCKASAKALNAKEEEVTNGCSSLEKVVAVGLPWKTLLELISGHFYDRTSPGPKGEQPGFAITCGGITDTCRTEVKHNAASEVANLDEVEGGLLLISVILPGAKGPEGESELETCSIGGKKEGFVTGEILHVGVRNGVTVSLDVD
ncbi:MAG TPA: hypothetical protein VK790_15330 [Solirubrobacteraceae bacterium]|jgi:hypothetical protein|nr:hypothetical protein [Solirubrobacteraceae bacterium]